MNSNIESYLLALADFLPTRKIPTTGRPPISKEIILEELYKLFKYNYGWRNVAHKTSCYK